ncbi:MAG: aldo/keto reductase [Phycisphaerae bacterium]|nr:aldo/keto reductase [Phycisphaerae bacterium]
MLYRTMPKNGDELSILGFGCMRLPAGKGGAIDQQRAIRQIREAVDRGVNYLDTAWPYHGGQSEPLVGLALKDGYRDKVRLATKLPSWLIETRQDMDTYLNRQLERLATDHIDYYLLHTLNGASWDQLERLGVVGFVEKALADGRIVNAGFSFHGAPDEFARIVDAYPWCFCQIQYNYLDEQTQAGTVGLKYAASKQMGVIVMEPLRGGNLALPEAPPAVKELWDQAERKRTPVEWALRWIWDHPEVTVALSGMNDEAQIAENLAIADAAQPNSLTDAEHELVRRVADKYRELMKVGCTGCGYCLPCPSGVAISEIFEIYNRMHMFGDESSGKFIYALRASGMMTGGDPGYASQCVQCGECLEKCPQNLEIPQLLAQVAEELEGPDLEEWVARAKAMMSGGAN